MNYDDRRSTGWKRVLTRPKAERRQRISRNAGHEPEHVAEVYLREWLSWRAEQRTREEQARPRLARPAWFDPERDNVNTAWLMAGR